MRIDTEATVVLLATAVRGSINPGPEELAQ